MKTELFYSLTNFKGPIELLYFLVQRDEIDIIETSLNALAYQEGRSQSDVALIDAEERGDFIYYLAQLLALKSRKLLQWTQAGISEEEPMPSPEFPSDLFHYIHEVNEYEDLKSIASHLEHREIHESAHFNRGCMTSEIPPSRLEGVSLQELASLFTTLLSQRTKGAKIIAEKWQLAPTIERLKEQISKGPVGFVELFSQEYPKEELIVLFLALLELMKQGFSHVVRKENQLIIQLESHT